MSSLEQVIREARDHAIAAALRKAKDRGEEVNPEELDAIVKEAVDRAVNDYLSELETH